MESFGPKGKIVIDHATVAEILRKDARFQAAIAAVITAAEIAFGIYLIFDFIKYGGAPSAAEILMLIIGAALAAFTIYDAADRFWRISKRKYEAVTDRLSEIRLSEIKRSSSGGTKITDILRFEKCGDYQLHNKTILEYTEVGDTFYVIVYEKKIGKKELLHAYNTKKYEWSGK